VREQLTEAYERLNGKTPAEVRKNVYKSLTFYWLYRSAPGGFTSAIQYGEEYVADARHLPSGGIWVNLACADGQNAAWLIQQGGGPQPDAELQKKTRSGPSPRRRSDPPWVVRLPSLMTPATDGDPRPAATEGDLAIFAEDAEIRVLVDLPGKPRLIPNPENPPPTPPMSAKISDPIFFQRRCDASGGIPISADQWVGANDEENILRLYRVDGGPPVNDTQLNLDIFLGVSSDSEENEADLESATALGELVFWIGSHSRSRTGKERPDRRRLFATELTVASDGSPALKPVGVPCKNLQEKMVADPRFKALGLDLAASVKRPPKDFNGFNIESLCAEKGSERLWIGLRNPIAATGAVLVPLENPRAVLEPGGEPILGDPLVLDLGGLGFRDMIPTEPGYLVLAGDYKDRNAEGAQPSALFTWAGPGTVPQRLKVNLGDLNPEALLVFPDKRVLIVSDDGTRPNAAGLACKKQALEERSFRAVWLEQALPTRSIPFFFRRPAPHVDPLRDSREKIQSRGISAVFSIVVEP
jgi:hypothetical protein